MDSRLCLPIVYKSDDEQRRVIAWAYIARKADGTLAYDSGGQTSLNGTPIEDATDRDVIDTPEALRAFEDSFYAFLGSGLAGADDMHIEWNVAKPVGGFVTTPDVLKALGATGTLPVGALVVIDVPRTTRGNALWADIKTGRKRHLSIVASVEREVIADAA